MALPINRRFNEQAVSCKTASVATTPVAAYCVAPCKGYVVRTFGVLEGTITTAAAAVSVAINGGSNIGALSIAVGAAGTAAEDIPTASESSRWVNEGDVISFTPSGATGSSIPANFHAVIRQA
jgi:hypothetical protein